MFSENVLGEYGSVHLLLILQSEYKIFGFENVSLQNSINEIDFLSHCKTHYRYSFKKLDPQRVNS